MRIDGELTLFALEALPVGATIIDSITNIWKKTSESRWRNQYDSLLSSEYLDDRYGPLMKVTESLEPVSEVVDMVEDSPVKNDPINPDHYTAFPVEVIEITERLNFCRGNVVKYVARAGLKSGSPEIEDLRKAKWYLDREIRRVELTLG